MFLILILSCLVACRSEFTDEMQEYEKECIGEDRFTCLDGSCIAHKQYCDGRADCADGSDENFCPDHPPNEHLCNVTHQFMCRDGHACIPATWVCNGAPDCTDASDETDCTETLNNTTSSKCGKAFACGNGACISNLWACDGRYDCEDRSDEDMETCKHSLKAHMESDGVSCYDFPAVGARHYKCLDSSFCLFPDQMCDGIADCRDASDEGQFCDKCEWEGEFPKDGHTMCVNTTCPAAISECTPERTGPRCICTLSPNTHWFNHTSNRCQDVDECLAERPSCSHRCQNYDGHFRCQCDVGYVADDFKYLCFAEGPEAMLFYSTEKDIRYIKVKTKQEVTVATGIKKSHGVSYDGKYLYWVETAEGHQAIARAHLENPVETKETLVSLGLYDPGDIAVDWLGGNIYFSDAARRAIYVCKTDGSMCTRLQAAAFRPKFITLDVRNGIMYWADITPAGRHVIMRARMDGSHHEVLLDDLNNFATGLAIDVPNDRLYFVDRTVRVLKVDTKQVYSLFEERFHHPYAISVFENTVYWSDWTSNTIQTTDKLHSAVKRNVLATLHTPIYGMHIYHPVLMNRDTNPCAVHNCSHMCLLTTNATYSCACPTGMLLNGTTCYSEQNYRPQYLIVGAGASFTRIQHDTLGNPEAHATTFDIGRVQAMAHDSRRDVLYVYDGMRKCINTIELSDFALGITRVFVFNGLENVVDMDYDYVTDTLYVLDAGRRFLEVFSLKDGKRALLHRFPDQEMPVSFCVLQHFGRLLVAVVESEQNNEIHIDSIGLDGDEREHQHVMMNNIKGPRVRLRHVTDSNIVAVSDESGSSIDFIHLKASASGVRQDIRKLLPTPISSLATLMPFVFWTDGRTPRIFWEEFGGDSSTPRRVELSMFPNDTHLHIQATSMAPKPNDPLLSHPCNKGPCSHICVQSPRAKIQGRLQTMGSIDSYKCLCPPGTIVEGGQCNKLVVCGVDESYCYKSNKCIPWMKRCDGQKDCSHGEDEEDCSVSTSRPSSKCLPTQVECNGGCIHGNEICPKEINETIPPPFYCEFEQFQCRDSRLCLEREQVCDQQQDCPDGSDEGPSCHAMRCLETEFMCASGNCILSSWRCDGDADCGDGSDEADCANQTCNVGSYQCRSGQCVDLHQRCDGQPDCVDGSDEERCQEPSDTMVTIPNCMDGEFPCELNKSICLPQTAWCNKVVDCPGGTDELGCTSFCAVHGLFECKQEQICLSMRRVCNHNKDCTDGSDETPEACAQVNRTSRVFPPYPAAECRHGFLCATGQCIEWREVCDHTPNCFDGSDENGQCFTACENNTCSQHCQPTPLGAQCTCRAGFELLSDQHNCVDTNECLKDTCSQHCTNTPGSFVCSCRHGYTLRSDRRSCKANIGATKSILYVSGYSVRSISDLGLGRVEFEDPTLGRIDDVGVNVAQRKIYVTSSQAGKLIEVTSPEPWTPTNTSGQNVITSIGKPTKLAVEWVTGNVYFVDNSTEPSIKVCNFDKKRCAIVKKLTTGVKITSLVVSPETRHFYYCTANTEQGSYGPVTGVGLGGMDPLNTQSGECTGLAVDGTVLYVAGPGELQSLDPERFYGNKAIPDWHHLSAQSITVFEDYVYVLSSDRVYRCLLFGAKTCQPYIYRMPNAKAFVILHPTIQRRDLRNECDDYKCDNVCVLGNRGPICLCEDGSMSGDGTCSLLEKSAVPLFNGFPSQDYVSEHLRTSFTLIAITLVLFIMYLTIFVYYHCVYKPKKDALTLPVRFQNQTSFNGSSIQTSTIEIPTTSGAGHEFVNPLQFVRNIWRRSFGKSNRPIGTAGLAFDIPRPKEDLSDTESDIDYKDEKILIRKP